MQRALRAEAIKLRRTWLWAIVGLAALAFAVITWRTLDRALARLAEQTSREMPWQLPVLGDTAALATLTFPTTIILVTALSFFIESRNGMWKQLWLTPAGKARIYAAKFILIQAIMAVGVAVAVLACAAFYPLLPEYAPATLGASQLEAAAAAAALGAKIYVSLLPIALFQFLLSAKAENVLYPLGIGLVLTFASLALAGPKTYLWIPYSYPAHVIESEFLPSPGSFLNSGALGDRRYRAPEFTFAGARPGTRRIIVDEAHDNYHGFGTTVYPGSLRWIREAAEAAGVEAQGNYVPLRSGRLVRGDLLIIAAPKSRLSGEEISVIAAFIRSGGSLLILAGPPASREAILDLLQALRLRLAPAQVPSVPRAFTIGAGRLVLSADAAPFLVLKQTKRGDDRWPRRETVHEIASINALRWLLALPALPPGTFSDRIAR